MSRAYYDDIHNSSMLIGPVGSGKTTTIIAKICRLALDQIPDEDGIARTRIGCVRATYPELWSATIDSWQTIFPPSLGAWKGSEGRRAHHAILLEENGKKARLEMDFIAIGDYGAESALRGYQATGFWLNEVDTLQRDTYEYVSGRAGRYPKTLIDENGTMIYGPSWAGLIMDLNAPDELSWSREVMRSNECKVYKQPPAAWPTDEAPMEARGEPPTWRSGPTAVSIEGTEWTTNLDAENLSHLPKDYYVKQIQASRDNKITRMIQNEPAASVYGTPVFGKSFRATYHVSENPIQPDPSRPILIGADAGRTPRAVIGQVRGTGQGVIFDEVCEDDMSAQNFGIRLRSYVNRRFPNFSIKAFCDPAAARVGDQDERPWMRIMTDVTGWQWRPAARFNNIGLRIEAVDAMLAFQPAPGSPGLLIDKTV